MRLPLFQVLELEHSIAPRVVSFVQDKAATYRGSATDWESWRERPLNSAWDAFIAPRRGRSRHDSFPHLNRNRGQGRHKTPPHLARVTSRNWFVH